MKKVLIIAAIVFATCNVAMAQKRVSENKVEETSVDYSFKVNQHAVCRYLSLDDNQEDQMLYICDRFDSDLSRVKSYKNDLKRYIGLRKAISYNLSAAHQVLDEKQYRKYLVIFNNTLRTKRLDKVIANGDMAMNE